MTSDAGKKECSSFCHKDAPCCLTDTGECQENPIKMPEHISAAKQVAAQGLMLATREQIAALTTGDKEDLNDLLEEEGRYMENLVFLALQEGTDEQVSEAKTMLRQFSDPKTPLGITEELHDRSTKLMRDILLPNDEIAHFVVWAYRYANPLGYNFPVGLFATLPQAEEAAARHREFRGSKYDHRIYKLQECEELDAEQAERVRDFVNPIDPKVVPLCGPPTAPACIAVSYVCERCGHHWETLQTAGLLRQKCKCGVLIPALKVESVAIAGYKEWITEQLPLH